MTSDVLKREKANKAPYKFMPQEENVGVLVFQNKAEEVNFDSLYILKIGCEIFLYFLYETVLLINIDQ